MPISGMTGNEMSMVRSLPCFGRLHKGAERTQNDIDKKRPGKDLDYFRFVPANGYEHVGTAIAELYGSSPRRLDHLFMLEPEIDKAFDAWMEEWSRTACLRRCDKKTQVLWFDGDNYHTDPKPCEINHCNCKQRGRLAFQIPALIRKIGEFGYISFSTGSANDIRAIDAYLRAICDPTRADRLPSLAGVPFVLERYQKEISTKIEGKRAKVPKWMVKLSIDPAFVMYQLADRIGTESATALLDGADIEAEEVDGQTVDGSTGELIDRPVRQSVPRIESGSNPDEPVDTNLKLDTDALRTRFFKAAHVAGVPSAEASKRLKAEGVTDLRLVTWAEAWSVIFGDEQPEDAVEEGDPNF